MGRGCPRPTAHPPCDAAAARHVWQAVDHAIQATTVGARVGDDELEFASPYLPEGRAGPFAYHFRRAVVGPYDDAYQG